MAAILLIKSIGGGQVGGGKGWVGSHRWAKANIQTQNNGSAVPLIYE